MVNTSALVTASFSRQTQPQSDSSGRNLELATPVAQATGSCVGGVDRSEKKMGNGRSKVKMSGESGVAGKKRSKGKTKKGGKEDGAVDFESGSGVAGGQEGTSGEYPTPEGDATTAGSDVTRGDDSGLAAAVWQDGMVNAERESGVASFDGEDESGIPSTGGLWF